MNASLDGLSSPRAAAGRLVKTAAAAADRLWPPRRGVVVLIYHRVGGRTGIEVDLPTELFDEQMAWLASHRLATTLDDALDAAARPTAPDRDPVVVTFDDGTADLVELALPILVEHKVPAVFYLSTDFVERGRPFPHNGTPLSWAGAREALATGLVTIGSHTHTHALLDRLDPRSAADELDRSVDLIAERTGVSADHFAYPKAVAPSPASRSAGTRPVPVRRAGRQPGKPVRANQPAPAVQVGHPARRRDAVLRVQSQGRDGPRRRG